LLLVVALRALPVMVVVVGGRSGRGYAIEIPAVSSELDI
jgi:hypothetical protein